MKALHWIPLIGLIVFQLKSDFRNKTINSISDDELLLLIVYAIYQGIAFAITLLYIFP